MLRKLIIRSLLVIGVAAFAVTAQQPALQPQVDGAGKQVFEVASVKPSKADVAQSHSNITLDAGDDNDYPTGGLLSVANTALASYISFAYNLTPNETMSSLSSQMPKWAKTQGFDIEARAAGNSTRADMKLMMQSLLADRFKLAVHRETRQLPILALQLVKPKNVGPLLLKHADDPPCASPSTPLLESTPERGGVKFPLICNKFVGEFVSGHWRVRGRNMTIERIASIFLVVGQFDRPIVDQTGLPGRFDFSLEFTPGFPGPQGFQPDPSGPTLLDALREQLGLKLKAETGPVDMLVIDHVEEPSPN
jgi:uncharacterized protein (TIGR03435 family)